MGTSALTRRPVTRDIAERFPATFELVTSAVLGVAIVDLFLGVTSAVYKRWIDQITRVLGIAGASMPIFWLGLLAPYLLYTWLGCFLSGRSAASIDPPTRVTSLYVLGFTSDQKVASPKK
ncbi:MAG: hypothetical protein NZ651_05530 [Candidatus Bipolaricaulota bacterium]|nr:hypothetical protein [Candidatus Bipolaricaulota bacterium]MDW8127215.1 hypothetical protein [Candidatus Bipolaricaulota bacterium]